LFRLFQYGYLHPGSLIIGYARSKMASHKFHRRIREAIQMKSNDVESIDAFLSICRYQDGPYDQDDGYERLATVLRETEEHWFRDSMEEESREKGPYVPLRLFYLALPPSVFIAASKGIRRWLYRANCRLIVEKPFGRDLASSNELSDVLASLFEEPEVDCSRHHSRGLISMCRFIGWIIIWVKRW
jgi:glucose-6-phosphate 1-dehydrogenase